MDTRTEQFLRFLAEKNVCDGVLYEPRTYFDRIDFSTSVNPTSANPDIFRNGEEYPVRITHLVAAIQFTGTVGAFPTGDERAIQRYGCRIRGHDTYYQNPDYVAFPCWQNVVTAASDIATRSQSTWKFWRPFYMGQRDLLEIKVQMEVAVAASNTQRVGVCFEGVGALSRRPKKLYGFIDVTDAMGIAVQSIPTDFFRNDGAEPLEIHMMTCHVGAASLAADPVGEIRQAKISVKQIGNGTNQRWSLGPVSDPPAAGDNLMACSLWGPTTSRAIVHALPKGSDGHPGWIWYPGEGVSPEYQRIVGSRTDTLLFGMLGHAIIK